MSTKPIPEGYTTITPSITVDGADQAIAFYKKAFGAEEVFRMGTPDGKIMHAEIRIGTSVVMLADSNAAMNCKSATTLGGSPVSFYVYVSDVDAAHKKAISAGCTQIWPIEDMFWGDRVGGVNDPYGLKWTLATHTKDVAPDQMKKGQEEFMKRFTSK